MRPNSWLQQQAQLYPERPAFYWKDKSWSFADLNLLVQKYATYYQHELPEKTERVALFSENSKEMYLTILALWELGIEIQFLNTRLTTDEIQFQLADAQAQVVIGRPLEVALPYLAFPKELPELFATAFIDNGYQLDSIASIMYTSGTTGKPKGVPQRFSNHRASALATQQNMAIVPEDCWLCPTTLYHISGLSVLLRSLVLGMSVRLYEKYDCQQIAQDIVEEKGTVISVVTKMLNELLDEVPECPNFRHFLLGGGPVPKSILERCAQKDWSVIQSFGMTETCSQVIALPPERAIEKIGSAGLPLNNMEIKIQQGEVLLKGPNVVTEYLNNRGTDSWDKQGWFHTGDLGYLDEEGFLFIQSRMSELIISGGENIYPAEVEQAIVAHPKVKEAAVVGEEDETWGQVPVAYLTLHQAMELSELSECFDSLARYKQPKRVYVVHDLPRTASGKPLKRKFLSEERVNYIAYQLR